MRIFNKKSIANIHCILLICLANSCFSQIKNEKEEDNPIIDFNLNDGKRKDTKDCCDETMSIYSHIYPEGYLKAPPVYDNMNEQRNSKRVLECLYKFYGKPGERIQLFYEDVDLYYPFDIYKFNKIDCRYADSVCLKFYDSSAVVANDINSLKKFESITLENHNYDLCNCINVSYTPRQIMSASHFIQVRFKTVPRSYESSAASIHSRKQFRGYLIRYKFTRDNGLDLGVENKLKETSLSEADNSSECKLFFRSSDKRSGYFSSPNYPGLYPRDILCHYFFIGLKNEKVQVTFHTFDVEGIDQCSSDTKSDYVELSNFQNRDRFYSRFCGVNKPGSVLSDAGFFHVTFYSNNVFDAKGFQASYYFVNLDSKKNGVIKSAAASVISSEVASNARNNNKSNQIKMELSLIIILINFVILVKTVC